MRADVPYASWPFIDGINVDGWRLGSLMRYVDERWGDVFVEAPDGARAGLVWVVRDGPIKQLLPPDEDRWGVYDVPFRVMMRTPQDLLSNFKLVLGELQALYSEAMANPPFQRTAARPLN